MKKDEREERLLKIFTRFKSRIESEFAVQNATVYAFSENQAKCIVGEKIENMVLERYIAYSTTMLLRSPVGLQEDKSYKSRMITQFYVADMIYLIVISSYQLEAFSQATKHIIDDVLKLQKEVESI